MKLSALFTAAVLSACPPPSIAQTNPQAKDSHEWIGTETVATRYGSFDFKNGYPTAESTVKLYEFRTFNRAVESYLHCVTLMSMFYMQKASTTSASTQRTSSSSSNRSWIRKASISPQTPRASTECSFSTSSVTALRWSKLRPAC